MLYLLWNKKSWRCPVGTMLGRLGCHTIYLFAICLDLHPKALHSSAVHSKCWGGGEWDTDAQMCSGSIKACAVVLGVCAVPTVCQTLVIIWTPAACLHFSPSCSFFPAGSAHFWLPVVWETLSSVLQLLITEQFLQVGRSGGAIASLWSWLKEANGRPSLGIAQVLRNLTKSDVLALIWLVVGLLVSEA